jgi:hypothetical protein
MLADENAISKICVSNDTASLIAEATNMAPLQGAIGAYDIYRGSVTRGYRYGAPSGRYSTCDINPGSVTRGYRPGGPSGRNKIFADIHVFIMRVQFQSQPLAEATNRAPFQGAVCYMQR